MTPADLERILRQPDMRAVNEHLLSATAAATGRCEALPAADVWLDASTQSRASYGVPVRSWRNEREFMAAVIAECDYRAIGRPEYGLIYHIPNENSHRQPGVRAGMPDLCLPCARGGYIGWFCELKIGSGKCSRAQLDMHYRLRMEGYRVVVVWDSVAEVMREIEEYLRL